jgi:ribosome maturation factor RimP
MNLQEQIVGLVQEKIALTENFLVEVTVNPGKIAVIIDHPVGVKIDDCVKINRFLHEKLDDQGVFDRYELEVGSPGMEEPLKILPQFKKRIGRQVSVVTFDGMKRTGILLNADENGIEINEETITREGRKKTISHNQHKIPFTDIKETRVIFSFDKII